MSTESSMSAEDRGTDARDRSAHQPAHLRIVTWNVNGLRAVPSRLPVTTSLQNLVDGLNADILCFQETKLTREQMDRGLASLPGYDAYFAFSRVKDGYSGVVTYCKSHLPVYGAEEGFSGLLIPYHHHGGARVRGAEEKRWNRVTGNVGGPYPEWPDAMEVERLDSEGRVVTTDHGAFVLFNVYAPNAANTERMQFQVRFLEALRSRCAALQNAGRAIVVAGDLNFVMQPIDHCDVARAVREYAELGVLSWDTYPPRVVGRTLLTSDPAEMECASGAAPGAGDDASAAVAATGVPPSPPLRSQSSPPPSVVAAAPCVASPAGVSRAGVRPLLLDAFRFCHRDRLGAFTCWNMRTQARQLNYGTRIDYLAVSAALVPALASCDLLPQQLGSDHCPVRMELHMARLPATPPALLARAPVPLPLLAARWLQLGRQASLRTMFSRSASAPSASAAPDPAPDGALSRPASRSALAAPRQTSVLSFVAAQKPAASEPGMLGTGVNSTTDADRGARDGRPAPAPASAAEAARADALGVGAGTQRSSPPSPPTDDTDVREASWVTAPDEPDAADSAREWRRLFTAPPPPRCRHGESCVRRIATTPAHRGRPFWCCARPSGAADDPAAACGYFAWADRKRGPTGNGDGAGAKRPAIG